VIVWAGIYQAPNIPPEGFEDSTQIKIQKIYIWGTGNNKKNRGAMPPKKKGGHAMLLGVYTLGWTEVAEELPAAAFIGSGLREREREGFHLSTALHQFPSLSRKKSLNL